MADSAGWRGPEFEGEFPTLGYEIIDWIHSLGLIVPAGDKIGEPLELTPSQKRFLILFYRLDENGRRFYRRTQLQGPKGNGKSPVGALICLVEFDGPSMFSHWDEDGEPVAKVRSDSVVSIVGLSEGQTGNMYDWLYTALVDTPAAEVHGWTVELGRITKRRGGYGVIEPATSSQSSTGRPQTFVAKEETWLWTKSSGMHSVSRALSNNVRKTGGVEAEFTNPPELGVETVAELTQRTAAREKRRPILLVHNKAVLPKEIQETGIKLAKNEKIVRKAIREAFGDSMKSAGGWMDEDDAYDAIIDEQIPEDEAYRLWLGCPRTVSGAIVESDDWDRFEEDRTIGDEIPVVIAFDGSISEDSTAIVVATVEETPHIEIAGIWEQPEGPAGDDWRVPEDEVEDCMVGLLSKYNRRVLMIIADSGAGWESRIDAWGRKWGRIANGRDDGVPEGLVWAIRWNNANRDADEMTRLFQSACQSQERMMTHNGDPVLRGHVLRMKMGGRLKARRPVKDANTPGAKIDAGVCAVMAYWAARHKFSSWGKMVVKKGHNTATKDSGGAKAASVWDDL